MGRSGGKNMSGGERESEARGTNDTRFVAELSLHDFDGVFGNLCSARDLLLHCGSEAVEMLGSYAAAKNDPLWEESMKQRPGCDRCCAHGSLHDCQRVGISLARGEHGAAILEHKGFPGRGDCCAGRE